jgi:hypothetical protein
MPILRHPATEIRRKSVDQQTDTGHLRVRRSLNLQQDLSTPPASSLPQGFLLLLAAPCGGHTVFYDGRSQSNLKLLKRRGLIDACITKGRPVTKVRKVLGPLHVVRQLHSASRR